MTPWTQQHEQILKEGHDAGKSARELAEELTAAGYPSTKNTVLGRIFRNGWSKPSTKAPRRRIHHAIAVADSSGCRWPIGDPGTPSFRFCCEDIRTAGKPYCPEHMAVAYRPREAA